MASASSCQAYYFVCMLLCILKQFNFGYWFGLARFEYYINFKCCVSTRANLIVITRAYNIFWSWWKWVAARWLQVHQLLHQLGSLSVRDLVYIKKLVQLLVFLVLSLFLFTWLQLCFTYSSFLCKLPTWLFFLIVLHLRFNLQLRFSFLKTFFHWRPTDLVEFFFLFHK